MSKSLFIGRKQELAQLTALRKTGLPCFIVVKGRRRIGKSRLIGELASQTKNKFWSFAGLAPEKGMSAQTQRDHFSRQLTTMLNIPPVTFQDWSDAFQYLSLSLQSGDIVLFDEISWMAAKDSSFIPKLKAWWDQQTKAIMLVACGSVSTWIESNILKSTAFFGRINLSITLEPLSISESALFLKNIGFHCSTLDTYKLLSILGGVPWYLEQLNPTETADENIKRLAFHKNGLLVHEFERVFHDLFDRKGEVYRKIIGVLTEGERTLIEIRQAIAFPHSGTLSALMENLLIAGFVQKQPLWSFKSKNLARKSLYRLCDPYLRFYLKVIEPRLNQIMQGSFNDFNLSALPGFDAHLGLQLEYLLLQNKSLVLKALGISPIDIVNDGTYRQTKNTQQAGCQIDYLIQTTTNNLILCEFKFHKREINSDIIDAMKEKSLALRIPRGFACVPALFHLSGVSSSVETARYFYRIIDISNFIENNEQ